MKVLILGASGLVGSNALAQTLAHSAVTAVMAPTRKPLPPGSKLTNPVAEQLEIQLRSNWSRFYRRRSPGESTP
jgi:uncharacterized protein YbjT (DUF2867 family)